MNPNPISLFLIVLPFLIIAFLFCLPDISRWYVSSGLASERGAVTMLGSNVQVPDEWGQWVVQQNSEFEIIHRPIYDTQTVATNQSANLNFFASQQATLDLGNEVFPLKNSYLVAAMGIYFKDVINNDNAAASGSTFASRANDHVLIVNTGLLSLVINGKNYGDWPMFKLAPGAGIWGLIAGGGTPTLTDYSQLGTPDPRAAFKLAIPLVIPINTKTQAFGQWPGGALSLSLASKMCVIFDGKEARVI